RILGGGPVPPLAPDSLREGLGGARLDEGIRRAGLDAPAALYLRRRVRQGGRAGAASDGVADVRPGADGLRHARAESLLPAAHAVGRALLVPGIFRAAV